MVLVNRDTTVLARSKGFDDWCLYTTELTLFDEIESIEAISNIQSRTKKLMVDEHGSIVCRNSDINEAMSYIRGLSEDEDYICIPTQSDLQKWLREIHNIQVIVTFNQIDYKSSAKSKNYSVLFYNIDNDIRRNNQLFNFKTYEQALEKGLQEALKLLPNKN